MISRLLSFAAVACCGLVVASFALFAAGQAAAGSAHQVQAVGGAPIAAASAPAAPAPRREAQPRRFIDGAAALLRSPFAGVVQSDSAWVNEALPSALALLAYGFGLGYVARLARELGARSRGARSVLWR
jgi:hypothetical protein